MMRGMVGLLIRGLMGRRGRVRRVVPTMVTAGVVNGARCDNRPLGARVVGLPCGAGVQETAVAQDERQPDPHHRHERPRGQRMTHPLMISSS